MARPSKGRCAAAVDRSAVADLAMYGLNELEIRLKLGLPANLSAKHREVLSAAIKEGRLRGSAEMKEAQYNAAREGQASAQARVLELLRNDDDEEEIEVVREIYGSVDDES